MRTEAQKEARRRYEASDKGKAARKRHEAAYVASGGRAETEKRRAAKPLSSARKQARARWSKANKDYYSADRSFRRSLERDLSEFDKFVLLESFHVARLRESFTGEKWHVDHVVPVSKGGSSKASNLQVVPARWNRSKSNKHSLRFFAV